MKRLYGTVDILINNVGSNIIGSVLGTSDEEVSYQMKVNYKGAVRLTKMLLPDMLEKKYGRIITISSVGGIVPLPYNSAYAASKAAIEAYMESFSYELTGTGVYTTLVEPIGITIKSDDIRLLMANREIEAHMSKVSKLHKKMTTPFSPSVSKKKVAKKVAKKIITKKKPRLRYGVGLPGYILRLMHSILPFRWFARIFGLWYN